MSVTRDAMCPERDLGRKAIETSDATEQHRHDHNDLSPERDLGRKAIETILHAKALVRARKGVPRKGPWPKGY